MANKLGGVKMETKSFQKQIIKYLLLSAGLVLCVIYFANIAGTAMTLWQIIKPLVLGFVIAYILNILICKIERAYFPKSNNKIIVNSRRPVSLLLSIFIIVMVLLLVINIVLPQIFNTFTSIAAGFPALINNINQWILKNEEHFPGISERIGQININWEGIAKNVAGYATRGISNIFNSSISMISVFTSGLFDLFVSTAFAIYLLIGKEKLLGQLKRLHQAFMKKEQAAKLNYVLSVTNESFSSYIVGQCTEAVILGTLCATGMWIFKFPYAATVGVFIGATALIPMLGAYIGAGVGVFLILMVDPIKAIWFIVYIVVLQQLENNLIYPRVVGTSVGLPGVWVLVSVVIGGGIGGIVGMVLGVPIVATVYKLLQAATRKRLAAEGFKIGNKENCAVTSE